MQDKIIKELETAVKVIKDRLDFLGYIDQEIEINYDSEYKKFDITAKGGLSKADGGKSKGICINYNMPDRPKEDIPPQ